MTTSPEVEEPRLSFAWIEQKRRSLLLPVFIILSLIAHAATFFLFQVTYPQQVTIPAPAPTVSVLDPSRDDHQAILRWVAATDPSLTALSSTAEPKGLLEVEYRPSFTIPRTPLRFIPPESEPVRFPPALETKALIHQIQPPADRATPPLEKAVTRLSISGPLARRPLVEGFDVQVKVEDAPQSTTLFVGVASDGVAKYSFLQSSSGQAKLDDAASAEVQRMRFAPTTEEITWGVLTIIWGDDVFIDGRSQNEKEGTQP